MAKNKPDLADVIRKKLQDENQTQEDYATRVRLDPDTFRAQLARNTYSPRMLEELAKLLNCEEKELERSYTFNRTKNRREAILTPTEAIQERVNRTIKAPPLQLEKDIGRLYSWLGENDLAVICSLNERPLEFTPNGWIRLNESLSQAVRSGAVFVYIRPTERLIEKYAEVLPESFIRRSPVDDIKDLKSKLIANGLDKDKVEAGIKLHQAEWCPFWSVGMRFGFYSIGGEKGESRDMALFARFPFGGSFMGNKDADPDLLLYSDQRSREAFQSYLIHSFESDPKLRPLLDRL